jgi:hypothetical protein
MIESKTLGGRLGVLSLETQLQMVRKTNRQRARTKRITLHKEPLAVWKEREDASRLSEMGSSVISEVVNRGRKKEKLY